MTNQAPSSEPPRGTYMGVTDPPTSCPQPSHRALWGPGYTHVLPHLIVTLPLYCGSCSYLDFTDDETQF